MSFSISLMTKWIVKVQRRRHTHTVGEQRSLSPSFDFRTKSSCTISVWLNGWTPYWKRERARRKKKKKISSNEYRQKECFLSESPRLRSLQRLARQILSLISFMILRKSSSSVLWVSPGFPVYLSSPTKNIKHEQTKLPSKE